MTPKLSKESADYGPGKPQAHCSICKHYIAKAKACHIVKGEIEPKMWCRYFSRMGTR